MSRRDDHPALGLDRDHHAGPLLGGGLTCHGHGLDGWPSRAQQRLNPARVEHLAHVAIDLQKLPVRVLGQGPDFNASTDHAQVLKVWAIKRKLAPAITQGDLRLTGLLLHTYIVGQVAVVCPRRTEVFGKELQASVWQWCKKRRVLVWPQTKKPKRNQSLGFAYWRRGRDTHIE